MRHEVGDSLKHTSGLKHECGEGDLVQVHTHSAPRQWINVELEKGGEQTHLSWDMREEITEPSCSSLQQASSLSSVIVEKRFIAQERDGTDKMDVSSGSVSSGILSSREGPRGLLTLDAAWLNKPIMSTVVCVLDALDARGETVGKCVDQMKGCTVQRRSRMSLMM